MHPGGQGLEGGLQALRSDAEFNSTVDPDLADKLEVVAQMGAVRLATVEYILGKEIFAEYNTITDIMISRRLPMCREEVSVM